MKCQSGDTNHLSEPSSATWPKLNEPAEEKKWIFDSRSDNFNSLQKNCSNVDTTEAYMQKQMHDDIMERRARNGNGTPIFKMRIVLCPVKFTTDLSFIFIESEKWFNADESKNTECERYDDAPNIVVGNEDWALIERAITIEMNLCDLHLWGQAFSETHRRTTACNLQIAFFINQNILISRYFKPLKLSCCSQCSAMSITVHPCSMWLAACMCACECAIFFPTSFYSCDCLQWK